MTMARKNIVDLELTPYYHCVVRCVRRAFLCGQDDFTGRNFDHRKIWIIERIKFLASVFAIDVCGYAVLDNHFHLVSRLLAELVEKWSDEEVQRRAGMLCPSTVKGIENWSEIDRKLFTSTWRRRLSSISWFMAKLNEYIARKANEEDDCKGRFWEGRFKSKALVDEGALLASMAYVDLNPIRAGKADRLDNSGWTSIQQRLREAAIEVESKSGLSQEIMLEVLSQVQNEQSGESVGYSEQGDCSQQAQLQSLDEQNTDSQKNSTIEPHPELPLNRCPALAPLDPDHPDGLPLTLAQYLELLEWTGRAQLDDKRPITGPPSELIEKCGLDPDKWLETVEQFGSLGGFAGHPNELRGMARRANRRWLKGQGRWAAMGYCGDSTPFSRTSTDEYQAAA